MDPRRDRPPPLVQCPKYPKLTSISGVFRLFAGARCGQFLVAARCLRLNFPGNKLTLRSAALAVRLGGAYARQSPISLQGRTPMNRRTTLMSIALLSLVACGFPEASFAQNSPLIGTWKLNLEKSKFPPGAAPRSQTATFEQDGHNIKNTNQTIDAQGNTTTSV